MRGEIHIIKTFPDFKMVIDSNFNQKICSNVAKIVIPLISHGIKAWKSTNGKILGRDPAIDNKKGTEKRALSNSEIRPFFWMNY